MSHYLPVLDGKISSLLICDSTQTIRFSTYLGAGRAVGFLYFTASAHRYSNLQNKHSALEESSLFRRNPTIK